jgi:hypothetical protein
MTNGFEVIRIHAGMGPTKMVEGKAFGDFAVAELVCPAVCSVEARPDHKLPVTVPV